MRRYLEKYLRGEKNNSVENKEKKEKRKKREKKKEERKSKRKEKSKRDFGRKNKTFPGSSRKKEKREREREKKRGFASLYGLQRSGGWISSGQELKLIYLVRAMRGHQNQRVLMRFQISDFREVESFGFRKCQWDFPEHHLRLKR